MVVNLCEPHFNTTAHCNKLCADGYDVTNLVSADPALRRRGFKLEYFLRPPLQVTLKFGFQVELCRVDVELWPWGMDRGQACKRLEISTSSDWAEQKQHNKNEENKHRRQKDGSKPQHSNGHQWSLQAQQWDEGGQQRGHVLESHSNHEALSSQPEFKLVARCELREQTRVCFTHPNFRPRTPFMSPPPPPPPPADCWQAELWSRGPHSLGAVTQLRVTVPYGGAASSLGLKALAVWGQPSRCCPTEEVERIKRVHEASKRQLQQPAFFALSDIQATQATQSPQPPASVTTPDDFLDPITQEVMTLPMLLPSGMSVDSSTLDEYQKREASWGRPPNDPFTGVPFTSTSQPLPNPQLKSRIDHFLLQKGMRRRDGMLGRQEQGEDPQASRLVVSNKHGQSQKSARLIKTSVNSDCVQLSPDDKDASETWGQQEDPRSASLPNNQNYTTKAQSLRLDHFSELDRRKRGPRDFSKEPADVSAAKKELLPQTKRPKNDSLSSNSCISHEQRLSASLDEALFSALKGRPTFTANLAHRRGAAFDPDPLKTTRQSQSSGLPSTSTGEKLCSGCSSSVSAYSTSVSSIYHLICGHLLCRTCVKKESTSSSILCPTCESPTPRSDVMRVHH